MTSTVASRPVLAGNSLAGCRVLDLLLEVYDRESVLVIAPPSTATADWHPSLAEHAGSLGVDVLVPDQVNDPWVLDRIKGHRADLLLSVYYTQIFRPALLATVAGPALNFHPALLPRHRGTAPLIWAIIEGDDVTGISVHDLTVGIDTGPTRYRAPIPIHPEDTGYSLHLKAAELVHALTADILRRNQTGVPLPLPVEQRGVATYHSLRDPRVNHIDWHWEGQRITDVIRALAPPLPGAYIDLAGDRIVISDVQRASLASPPEQSPGLIDVIDSGPVHIWAVDGPLLINEVVWQGTSLRGADLAARFLPHSGMVVR